ncbi:MAG TPA: DNRLRE domain-containing protein, partial [Isosphaeraceae bacterium]|nr:DNRLRE domain-containing protein [Isosphaeraceae bacterium]
IDMTNCMICRAAMASICVLCAAGRAAAAEEEKRLFEFKGANEKAWTQYLPDNPKVPGAKEPPVKIEFSKDSQASDRPCLKITYAGGKYPAIATPAPLEDWTPYKQFQAGVTAGRTCVAAFRVVRLDDKNHHGWVKLALLKKGHNVVTDLAPTLKGPTQFEILMYAPHEGETLLVDDIRVSTEAPRMATPYLGEHVAPGDNLRFYPKLEKIPLLGLDTPVANCAELAKRMADKWVRPEDKPIERVEADFLALYERLKKDHPRAILATFRNGQKGYVPTAPEKEYAGWDCTGTSAHGPNAVHLEALGSLAGADRMEVTFRGRPPMMRLDFSSIPMGSDILAAQLVLVRAGQLAKDWDSRRNYFVAEFCNRPWKEAEVNTFEYAKDQFWKELHGASWDGDDPDFLPMFIAHGPSQGTTNAWDFTQAVKWWTDGKHPNHGFTLYNAARSSVDYLWVHSCRAKDVRLRPALMVIYEPKQ